MEIPLESYIYTIFPSPKVPANEAASEAIPSCKYQSPTIP